MTADHLEDWPPDHDGLSADAVERLLEEIDAEAAEHSTDYAAGMRHTRLLVEQEYRG